MTKYFIDAAGKYLGGFDGTKPPAGAVEIPDPPEHGDDVLIDGVWDKTGRRVLTDTRKSALLLILEELKALRPAKATAIQNLMDRIQGES